MKYNLLLQNASVYKINHKNKIWIIRDNISWIFRPDDPLSDIYIQETSLNDWGKVIDLLNDEYDLKYFSENKIYKMVACYTK